MRGGGSVRGVETATGARPSTTLRSNPRCPRARLSDEARGRRLVPLPPGPSLPRPSPPPPYPRVPALPTPSRARGGAARSRGGAARTAVAAPPAAPPTRPAWSVRRPTCWAPPAERPPRLSPSSPLGPPRERRDRLPSRRRGRRRQQKPEPPAAAAAASTSPASDRRRAGATRDAHPGAGGAGHHDGAESILVTPQARGKGRQTAQRGTALAIGASDGRVGACHGRIRRRRRRRPRRRCDGLPGRARLSRGRARVEIDGTREIRPKNAGVGPGRGSPRR